MLQFSHVARKHPPGAPPRKGAKTGATLKPEKTHTIMKGYLITFVIVVVAVIAAGKLKTALKM